MISIQMLGTGYATVTKCYNTCYVIKTEQGNVMVDAGGGNTILAQMENAGLKWQDIKALYITHAHTDHILGCIWALRKFSVMMKGGKYQGELRVYGMADNLDYVVKSCEYLLNGGLHKNIQFIPVADGDRFTECGINFEVMDIHSTKQPQIGYRAWMEENGQHVYLVCPGDEPCEASCEKYAEGADWLLHEAFCLKDDADKFKPYEKHHSTAYDAGVMAERLHVKNLLLYHTEDTDLEHRAGRYAGEAKENFSGHVVVPADLEEIRIL